MSTPDTPETPALTRRQLRELRQTGATPIITPQMQAAEAPVELEAPTVEPEAAPAFEPDAAPASEPQAAPASEPEAPSVIEAVPGGDAESAAAETPVAEKRPDSAASADRPAPIDESAPAAAFGAYSDASADLGVAGLTRRQARAQEKIRTASVPVISPDLEPSRPLVGAAPTPDESARPAIFRPAAADEAAPAETPAPSVVNPALGSELLQGETPDVTLPASFDQLLSRTTGATGTVSTPNSLILSQTPAGVPLVGPVNATGEIMITGTFDLPAGLGSVGHAPGTTDGRDADAVLLDGELPAASSPTPIAASAAISTVKQPGEIIRPPAPEKGSKLLIALIITTGVLALGVAVTLGLAFTTGVFR
ncbi:hypothetical protein [Microbacterium enclense]|uniref:Uncharacterized protein n=1 Tax=Microbacterium enclense TaxID=993073 RepID=A0A1G6HJT0_9MICO|nr:hypothetical protein [Microbacterium enclense]KSU55414.1 hypothetical protein AS029_05210 [Microbacterium enclense]SDB94510.1 hypothetical protein SAMN05216418_1291 [Microbacterium enclense]